MTAGMRTAGESRQFSRFIHGKRNEDILSLRLLRGLMRVRTRNWDEERLRIKCGDHRSMKPAAREFAKAGGLKWPQKPDQ